MQWLYRFLQPQEHLDTTSAAIDKSKQCSISTPLAAICSVHLHGWRYGWSFELEQDFSRFVSKSKGSSSQRLFISASLELLGSEASQGATMHIGQGTGGKLTSGSEGTFSPGLKVYLKHMIIEIVVALLDFVKRTFAKAQSMFGAFSIQQRIFIGKNHAPGKPTVFFHRTGNLSKQSNHSQLDFTGHWLNWCPAF